MNAEATAARPLPELMAEVSRRRDTGVLAVIGPRGRRELLFVNGELRAARSDIETERLGSWLVARQLLSEELKQLSLLKQGTHEAPPLGHILVRRGLVEQALLETELEELTLSIVARAAAEPDATASFQAGTTAGQPDTLPNIATEQVILHAARAFTDEDAKHAALAQLAHTVRLTRSLDDLVHEYEFELPEAVLLGRLHRGQRLGDLIELSNLPLPVFEAGLYALLTAGIVEIVPEERRPQPPPVARGRPKPSPGSSPSQPTGGRSAREPSTPQHAPPRPPASGPVPSKEEILALAGSLGSLDHYQLLELEPDASYQDVFDAWDRFSNRYEMAPLGQSPLVEVRAELEAVLRRGREAFETLSSTQKRPSYDRMVRATLLAHRSQAARGPAHQRADLEQTGEDAARSSLARANYARADEALRAGDMFTAVQLLEQACALEPHAERLLELARLMLINPQWSNRALEKLQRALELDPGLVEGWMEVAEFWRHRCHDERERKALERALYADPEHQDAVARYADLMGQAELDRLLARLRRSSG